MIITVPFMAQIQPPRAQCRSWPRPHKAHALGITFSGIYVIFMRLPFSFFFIIIIIRLIVVLVGDKLSMWCFILFQVHLASLQSQKVIHSNTSFKNYYSKLAVCRLLTMVIEDPQITKINLYISKQNPIKYVHFTIKEMKQKKLRICLSNGLYSVFCHILLNWLRRSRKLIKFSVSNYDKCSIINNK